MCWVEIGIVDRVLGRARPVLHTDRVVRKAGRAQVVLCVLGSRHGLYYSNQLVGWIAPLDARPIGSVSFHGLVRAFR